MITKDDQPGYAVRMSKDGSLQVRRASYLERVESKIMMLLDTVPKEVPCGGIGKRCQARMFVHEPHTPSLGVQLHSAVNVGVGRYIPEIILEGVYVDGPANLSPGNSDEFNETRLTISFRLREEPSVQHSFSTPLSSLGVT
jgi:hypothetical protein